MLIESECQIMDLWDAGRSMEAIVTATGRDRRYVYRIVSRYTTKEDDNFEAAVRAGSDRLRDAILAAQARAVAA